MKKSFMSHMKPHARTLSIVTLAALLTGGSVLAQRRYEPNSPDSFLRYQVDSTSELVQEVRTNAVLRKRFAKHFGVSETEVVEFVRRALIPYRLPQERTVTVYGVRKNGQIYGVRQRMKKGTRVWANRSGVPVLKWLCANPMTNTLPIMPRPPRTAMLPRTTQVAALPPNIPVTRVSPQVETYGLTTPFIGGVTGAGGGSQLAIPAAVSGGGGGIPLWPAIFVPLAFAGGGGDRPPTTEIPEPGTVALIAFGAPAVLMALRRRKNRKDDGAR